MGTIKTKTVVLKFIIKNPSFTIISYQIAFIKKYFISPLKIKSNSSILHYSNLCSSQVQRQVLRFCIWIVKKTMLSKSTFVLSSESRTLDSDICTHLSADQSFCSRNEFIGFMKIDIASIKANKASL